MNTVSEAPALAVASTHRSVDELVAELLYLSADKKLEIITRLAQSLQSAPAATAAATADQQTTLPAFIGAWANDPEADKMEQAIRSIRQPASEPELR